MSQTNAPFVCQLLVEILAARHVDNYNPGQKG